MAIRWGNSKGAPPGLPFDARIPVAWSLTLVSDLHLSVSKYFNSMAVTLLSAANHSLERADFAHRAGIELEALMSYQQAEDEIAELDDEDFADEFEEEEEEVDGE